MMRFERRLLSRMMLLGAAVTLLVAVLDGLGWLTGLERIFYDRRARDCQFFAPPPTDQLVFLDIDDAALENLDLGRWPWDRSKFARIIDELRVAGTSAVAIDVMFPEPDADLPKAVSRRTTPRMKMPAEGEKGAGKGPRELTNDEDMAAAMAEHGRVIMALSLKPANEANKLEQAMEKLFMEDLELASNAGEVAGKLEGQAGPKNQEIGRVERLLKERFDIDVGKVSEEARRDATIAARREATYKRIDQAMLEGVRTQAALQQAILPNVVAGEMISDNLSRAVLTQQFLRAQSVYALRRYGLPAGKLAVHMARTDSDIVPTQVLAEEAGGTGFVDYRRDEGGKVRAVPLFLEHRGWVFPQFAFALACMKLGVRIDQVIIEPERIVIPVPQQEPIVIPTYQRKVQGTALSGTFTDIPWSGPGDDGWKVMLDPEHQSDETHVPIAALWSIWEAQRRIADNNRNADKAISVILDDDEPNKLAFDPARAKAYVANLPDPSNTAARMEITRWTFEELKKSQWLEQFSGLNDKDLDENTRLQRDQLFNARDALRFVLEHNERLEAELIEQRQDMKKRLGGKAVIIGWVATAAVADTVSTSIHADCPGMVVHGYLFNGIMTRHLWRRAPGWVTLFATLICGLVATLLVSRLTPFWAVLTAGAVLVAYILVNGIWWFDYGNLIVGVAGPVTSVISVWGVLTVFRFIVEQTERTRITRRFRSYADPALVNYLLEHPDQAKFDGEEREMSAVFTDLEGFTTISERLKEQTVPLLNEYMRLMVPAIRDNDGYTNKFLGDGIMILFGAPKLNPGHAAAAVRAVLQMHMLLPDFNAQLEKRGLPRVSMRAGITTGLMVVGDAGHEERCDYTAIGDLVNLAARLESGNKYTGTQTLCVERTVEMLNGDYLVRPVGKLKVVGKNEVVAVYEPLCLRSQAGDVETTLADLTTRVVELYQAAKFAECLEAVAKLAGAFGENKFTKMYHKMCEEYMEGKGEEPFLGQIVLTAK